MHRQDARRAIESLRAGIPPSSAIQAVTVARKSEADRVFDRLQDPKAGLALVVGDYGSGKTHFLEYVMQRALSDRWVVSRLTLDARNGVRMNRMDQFIGALNRGIRVPVQDEAGIAGLLEAACRMEPERDGEERSQIECRPMLSAFANWKTGDVERQGLVKDWLENPTSYTNNRNYLRWRLTSLPAGYSYQDWPEYAYSSSRGWLSKPSDFSFAAPKALYRDGWASFVDEPFHSSWTWVENLPKLAQRAGFRGVLVLIDEFEDATSNLRRRDYVDEALDNVSGLTQVSRRCLWVLAVTPSSMSEADVLTRCELDSDQLSISDEAIIELQQLSEKELSQFARRVIRIHEAAFRWQSSINGSRAVADLLHDVADLPVDGRPRALGKRVVEMLDDELAGISF